MKSAAVITSLLATLAIAGPIRRAVVTEWKHEVVTVTVTAYRRPSGVHKHQQHPRPSVPTSGSSASSSGIVVPSTTVVPIVPPSTTSTAVVVPTDTTSVPVSVPPSTSMAVVIPSSSSASAQPSTPAGTDNLPTYAKAILDQHNIHRENHTAPAMVWNETLVASAKQIAETCVYEHSKIGGDGDYGQNIGAGAPENEIPKMITNSMYNGEMTLYPGYGAEPDMTNFHVWGHFSQIVWVKTTSVGCYTKKCGSLAKVSGNVKPYFTVCNYYPAGNFGKQYAMNVLKPKGMNSVTL